MEDQISKVDILTIRKYISKKCKVLDLHVILTGSVSLSVLGMLDREPDDLDFIVECADAQQAMTFKSLLNPRDKSSSLKTSFMKRGVHVDVYFKVGAVEICKAEYLGMSIANPLETMRVKLHYGSTKSTKDMYGIIKKMFK